MNYLASAILGIVFVELLLRLPVSGTVRGLSQVAGKSLKVISSRQISDHWKEKVLLQYSGKIAKHTLTLGILFLFIIAVVYVASMLLDGLLQLSPSVVSFMLTIPGLLFVTVVSFAYAVLRNKL